MKRFILIGLFIGYLAGWYNAKSNFNYPNIYNEEGLKQLDEIVKNDKTQRLGLVLLTAKGNYEINSLMREKYQIFSGVMDVSGQIFNTNLVSLKEKFVQKDPVIANKIMAMG